MAVHVSLIGFNFVKGRYDNSINFPLSVFGIKIHFYKHVYVLQLGRVRQGTTF